MSGRILLGIDPGFAAFGWALLVLGDGATDDHVVAAGVIHTEKSAKKREVRGSDDNVRRTRVIADKLFELLTAHEPVAVAAESFSPPRNASTAAKVALAWGAVVACARAHLDPPLLQASPQELKIAVCGSKSASKEEIEAALAARYPSANAAIGRIKQGDREHVWDAIGAAHACLDTEVVRMARRMR